MSEEERRMLAHRVVYTLWPDTPRYPREHMTPQVAEYVLVVFARLIEADVMIKSLQSAITPTPPTSWMAISVALLHVVRAHINDDFSSRGMAIQAIQRLHGRFVQDALKNGPEICPLELDPAFR